MNTEFVTQTKTLLRVEGGAINNHTGTTDVIQSLPWWTGTHGHPINQWCCGSHCGLAHSTSLLTLPSLPSSAVGAGKPSFSSSLRARAVGYSSSNKMKYPGQQTIFKCLPTLSQWVRGPPQEHIGTIKSSASGARQTPKTDNLNITFKALGQTYVQVGWAPREHVGYGQCSGKTSWMRLNLKEFAPVTKQVLR